MARLKSFSDSKGRIAFDLVRKEIKQVEKQISEQVKAFDSEVEPYIDYICNTSGKRIRPALAILAGGALGKISDDNLKIGVIFELIHMATLVHDDIIDEADTRRKTPTPNAKWGNGMAVLLGDALFSHALLLATEFGSIDICRKVGTASREVCQAKSFRRNADLTSA
ncbi:polyprenyl synthetase family protein [Rubritalea profundi]|uniref:polyprenyl synthetase family protein n=1 Tax=Rubritalea profundi TaxID=1658618 RepID=UPI0023E82408|nr:polyprenyl synthetase family protein [Rubritalea profundi]